MENTLVFQNQDVQKRYAVRNMYTFKNDFILYTKTKFGIKIFLFAFDPHVQGFQARAAAGLGLETAVFFPFLYAGPENPKKTRSQGVGQRIL